MSTPEPVPTPAKKRLFTKRFVLAAGGLLIASGLCALGKITGDVWALAFVTSLAGHGAAADVVKAYRRPPP